jgi:hypothetical protein
MSGNAKGTGLTVYGGCLARPIAMTVCSVLKNSRDNSSDFSGQQRLGSYPAIREAKFEPHTDFICTGAAPIDASPAGLARSVPYYGIRKEPSGGGYVRGAIGKEVLTETAIPKNRLGGVGRRITAVAVD